MKTWKNVRANRGGVPGSHPVDPRRRGFSLTEVVIAMAIVSVTVVGMMTAFPVGMKAARDCQDELVTSLIADDIFARIRAQPFTIVQMPDRAKQTVDLSGNASYATDMTRAMCYAATGRIAYEESKRGSVGADTFASGFVIDEPYYAVRIFVSHPFPTTPVAKVAVDISWPVRSRMDSAHDNRKHSLYYSYVGPR